MDTKFQVQDGGHPVFFRRRDKKTERQKDTIFWGRNPRPLTSFGILSRSIQIRFLDFTLISIFSAGTISNLSIYYLL